MKKLLIVALLVAMALSLSACVDVDNPKKEQYQEATTTQGAKNEVFGLNETAVFNDLKFTATEIKVTTGSGYFAAEAGKVFVGVKFVVENVSDEEQTISSIMMFDGYVDDIKSEYSFNAMCAFDDTLDGTLLPGKKLVGWYALEVPEEWSYVELSVKASWLSSGSAVFKFENSAE